MTLLQGKHILLGVTGSIAVYKAVDLASKLTQAGALVDVIMTEGAQNFVTPLTFQGVTGRPVYTDMWRTSGDEALPAHIAHIGLAESADLLIIAPATAHTLAKLAHGMADNLLTVTAIAAHCPLIIAPAMDGHMYQHAAVQNNLALLMERGAYIIEPDEGRFASGLRGKGRLPETPDLLGHIRRVLGQNGPLAGKRVVVTAGGTREAIDPVRYITNRSSGKQGYALAQAAVDAGAEVVLISTAQHLPIPVGVTHFFVDSAEVMHDAVLYHIQSADALIMAAAVADFRPAQVSEQKIKKTATEDTPTLPLTRTPDILLSVKRFREEHQQPQVVIGFAAESQNLLENARSKRERKGVDILVANDISAADAGFAVDTNRVTILSAQGEVHIDRTSKARVAEIVIGYLADMLA
ncbi:MAG: bifunctional phosphopantothenoylcysteine decarboxylase/phosphopantothenate--cysteine ligase CoaBC [Chloroflexi bacterium]|nr:MAG: bifunctional phosphopantothenoylcysteine decarboxylase/phosphopantothenate--cysteine ligase CoaBC [Chloroflexota bacterium]